MKIDVTQKITGFDGKPVAFLEPSVNKALQTCIQLTLDIDEGVGNKLAEQVAEKYSFEKTLKDVMITTLMLSDQNATREEKKKDFLLLTLVSGSDKPDLDITTRKYIAKRIWKAHENNLLNGRCEEMLLEDEEEEQSKKAE